MGYGLKPLSQPCAASLAPAFAPSPQHPVDTIERFEIVSPVIAKTDALRLTCSYAGAILLAPRPEPKAGQQAFSWGRRLRA
jgi:hypothetical protein